MARSFNGGAGNTDFLSVADNSVLRGMSQLTLNAWVKATAWTNATQGLIGKWATSNEYILRVTSAGVVQFFTNTTAVVSVSSAATVGTGAWHMVTATYDGSTMRIYIDAVLDSNTSSQSGSISNGTSSSLIMGADYDHNSDTLNGSEAEASVWSKALTGAEITAMYNSGVNAQIPSRTENASLVGYWPIWGVLSPEPDISGNANNATVTGTSKSAHAPMEFYLVQAAGPAIVTAATTVSQSFSSTPTVGNWVVTTYWGKETTGLLSTPSVTDNQSGNSYSSSFFTQDTLLNGGEFVGEAYGKVASASGTFTMTVTVSQTSRIDMVTKEFYASPSLSLDKHSTATGSSASPAPGSITTTSAPCMLSNVASSAGVSNPDSALSIPGGIYTGFGSDNNGATQTIGAAAFSTGGVVTTTNPTYAITSAAWACGQADYLLTSPQPPPVLLVLN